MNVAVISTLPVFGASVPAFVYVLVIASLGLVIYLVARTKLEDTQHSYEISEREHVLMLERHPLAPTGRRTIEAKRGRTGQWLITSKLHRHSGKFARPIHR